MHRAIYIYLDSSPTVCTAALAIQTLQYFSCTITPAINNAFFISKLMCLEDCGTNKNEVLWHGIYFIKYPYILGVYVIAQYTQVVSVGLKSLTGIFNLLTHLFFSNRKAI